MKNIAFEWEKREMKTQKELTMSERFTPRNPNLGMNRKTSDRIGFRNDSAIIGHDRLKLWQSYEFRALECINSIIIELSNGLVSTFRRFFEELWVYFWNIVKNN